MCEELKEFEILLNKEKAKGKQLAEVLQIQNDSHVSEILKLRAELEKLKESKIGHSEKKHCKEFKLNVLPPQSLTKALDTIGSLLELIDPDILAEKVMEKCKTSKHTEDKIKTLENDLDVYRKAIRCSVCNDTHKDCLIQKCWHTFCRKCLEANLNKRNRKCPTCKSVYDRSDIRPLFF